MTFTTTLFSSQTKFNMWLDTLYWSVIGVIDVLAILFNAFLIYLALYRTPKMVRVYTTLIINLAFTDCCSAFLNFFVQQRMIPTAFTIGYISNGFCKYFGYRVCFFRWIFAWFLFQIRSIIFLPQKLNFTFFQSQPDGSFHSSFQLFSCFIICISILYSSKTRTPTENCSYSFIFDVSTIILAVGE